MLKAAIEKIEAMSRPMPFNVDGRTFVLAADGIVQEVRPEPDMPFRMTVNSLDALVKLIQDESGTMQIFVSVASATAVEAFGALDEDNGWRRMQFYRAEPKDVPGWEPETTLPFDEAAVALMTRFQESEDREYCLRLLSQITTGAKVTYADNGIASTIVMQKGASLAENVTIKPLVRLRPYRTFQEVEQPEGLFLIRVRERGIAFIEADGGMWKLTARNTVKAWLQEQLKDCGGVTVML